jgi:hypothetical protein
VNEVGRGGAPWTTPHLVRVIVPVAVGALIVALAWNGVSARAQLNDQKGWITVGVAGFAMAVAGQMVWLKRGRRAVAIHAARLQDDVSALVARQSRPAPAPIRADGVRADGLIAATGMRHFHRSGCPIVAGQAWRSEPRGAHEAAGRTPCGICFRGTPPGPRGTP